MSSYARKHKVDSYHYEACAFLEACGFSVRDRSKAGCGIPDVAVGMNGVTDEIEFKTGDEPLTEAQRKYHDGWRGRPIVITRSLAELKEWALRTAHERKRVQGNKLLPRSAA